jgi:hypothetical protein
MMVERARFELVYKKRYGAEEWQAALKRAKDGKLPWVEAA